MRRAIVALLVAGGGLVALALGGAPAQAVGTRYPYCITGDDQPGLSNCTFTSYEQCAATASGRRLYCVQNPYYAGDNTAPAYGEVPPPYGRRAPPPPTFYPPPPPYRSY